MSSLLSAAARLKSRQSVEGARAFAHLTFEAADVSGGGTLTTSALRTYFEGHPEQEQHILGDDFLWNNFFQLMDSKFADGDVFSFDETEFTAAVVQVYVYVPAADEAAEASAVGAVDAAKEDAIGNAADAANAANAADAVDAVDAALAADDARPAARGARPTCARSWTRASAPDIGTETEGKSVDGRGPRDVASDLDVSCADTSDLELSDVSGDEQAAAPQAAAQQHTALHMSSADEHALTPRTADGTAPLGKSSYGDRVRRKMNPERKKALSTGHRAFRRSSITEETESHVLTLAENAAAYTDSNPHRRHPQERMAHLKGAVVSPPKVKALAASSRLLRRSASTMRREEMIQEEKRRKEERRATADWRRDHFLEGDTIGGTILHDRHRLEAEQSEWTNMDDREGQRQVGGGDSGSGGRRTPRKKTQPLVVHGMFSDGDDDGVVSDEDGRGGAPKPSSNSPQRGNSRFMKPTMSTRVKHKSVDIGVRRERSVLPSNPDDPQAVELVTKLLQKHRPAAIRKLPKKSPSSRSPGDGGATSVSNRLLEKTALLQIRQADVAAAQVNVTGGRVGAVGRGGMGCKFVLLFLLHVHVDAF